MAGASSARDTLLNLDDRTVQSDIRALSQPELSAVVAQKIFQRIAYAAIIALALRLDPPSGPNVLQCLFQRILGEDLHEGRQKSKRYSNVTPIVM